MTIRRICESAEFADLGPPCATEKSVRWRRGWLRFFDSVAMGYAGKATLATVFLSKKLGEKNETNRRRSVEKKWGVWGGNVAGGFNAKVGGLRYHGGVPTKTKHPGKTPFPVPQRLQPTRKGEIRW